MPPVCVWWGPAAAPAWLMTHQDHPGLGLCVGGGGEGAHTQQTADSRQQRQQSTADRRQGHQHHQQTGDCLQQQYTHASRVTTLQDWTPPPKRTLTTTATRPHPPTFHHLQHHHPRPRCACVRPTNHTRQPSSTSAPCLVHPGVNRHPQGHCQRLCARHLSTEGQGEGPRFEGGWGPAGGEGGTRPVCVGGGGRGRGAGGVEGWRGCQQQGSRAGRAAGRRIQGEREGGGVSMAQLWHPKKTSEGCSATD